MKWMSERDGALTRLAISDGFDGLEVSRDSFGSDRGTRSRVASSFSFSFSPSTHLTLPHPCSQSNFQLTGHARALANLSIGQITLDPIQFNVTSDLLGLQGLKGETDITAVDVVGGTPEAILLAINVSIGNPSNLELGVGDLCEYSSDFGRSHLAMKKGSVLRGFAILVFSATAV